ncbi:hypothetical protein ACFLXY_09140 [Chloroflexota bacterium]
MLYYLAAKATEYRLLIEWIESKLEILTRSNTVYKSTITKLQERLVIASLKQGKLDSIANSGLPSLAPRGMTLVRDIQFDLLIVIDRYLPALLEESDDTRSFRSLILKTTMDCGLNWVEDIVVRLDGPHATFVVIPERPLLISPPSQTETLIDLPGVYHEIGHAVFTKYSEIRNTLSHAVDTWFQDLLRQSSRLRPEQRLERERQIMNANSYWSRPRIAELFCDIFGIYYCGLAYYYCCINLALRFINDPFIIIETDVHPPAATRVGACDHALFPQHRSCNIYKTIIELWNDYKRRFISSGMYGIYCSNEFIDHLTDKCVEAIETYLPHNHRYQTPLQITNPPIVTDSNNLEDILNYSVIMLLVHKDEYPAWERDVLLKPLFNG